MITYYHKVNIRLARRLTIIRQIQIYKRLMKDKRFLSTTELAKILGISRVAVYKRIKNGQIKATRVGRNFVIERKDLGGILDEKVTREEKIEIEKAVKKTVKEYGETLRLLGTA